METGETACRIEAMDGLAVDPFTWLPLPPRPKGAVADGKAAAPPPAAAADIAFTLSDTLLLASMLSSWRGGCWCCWCV